MEQFKGAVAIGFLRLFACLPFALAQRLGALVGWAMYQFPNREREVTRINLQHCMPELEPAERERLVRETMIQSGRTFAESACAWIWKPEKTLKRVKQVEGEHLLHEALDGDKGVVFITSHLGNWEVLNHWYSLHCAPVGFYRPPKLKAIDDLLRRQRAQLGNRLAPSTREGISMVMREVRQGGAVGIPVDPEPARKSGEFVPFFAIQALTSKFVPNLLKGGQARGVFLHCVRLEDHSGFKVIVEPAPEAMYSADAETAVASMSSVLERYVRQWPSQYMWSMKRFKKRPQGEEEWY
ncbi:lysophospholipid acyltransferase [Halopseudomonas salegens]|uniref:KDO2-lipid IV(A) lauroyltransferase n=1 Tax=Halopseudomonas salegens TaxID=1434072 RepID=A0A1H2HN79_9GAMM|nr:lysophospholipid acyltransferase [Halopseudomonas salegens]SDU33189.1 KDO2-lipid IV(A) lauroyltransferase [Halopseudomonas salegens]